jgi:hypothetical protein
MSSVAPGIAMHSDLSFSISICLIELILAPGHENGKPVCWLSVDAAIDIVNRFEAFKRLGTEHETALAGFERMDLSAFRKTKNGGFGNAKRPRRISHRQVLRV